jgi:hypothetical protein
MSAVTDFKTIARQFNRMEQKAEWDKQNPPPALPSGTVVWTPEHGYGVTPFVAPETDPA